MKLRIVIIIAVICTLFNACKERKQVQYTPWGTPMVGDSIVDDDGTYGLSDIVGNGEMIMLTVSGLRRITTTTVRAWACSICCASVLRGA